MGTSNVSFGLPARPRINVAFLTMAFACGMNAPIINPLDKDIQDAFINARLLLGLTPAPGISSGPPPFLKSRKQRAPPLKTCRRWKESKPQ